MNKVKISITKKKKAVYVFQTKDDSNFLIKITTIKLSKNEIIQNIKIILFFILFSIISMIKIKNGIKIPIK